jgi:hypothetical protein
VFLFFISLSVVVARRGGRYTCAPYGIRFAGRTRRSNFSKHTIMFICGNDPSTHAWEWRGHYVRLSMVAMRMHLGRGRTSVLWAFYPRQGGDVTLAPHAAYGLLAANGVLTSPNTRTCSTLAMTPSLMPSQALRNRQAKPCDLLSGLILLMCRGRLPFVFHPSSPFVCSILSL